MRSTGTNIWTSWTYPEPGRTVRRNTHGKKTEKTARAPAPAAGRRRGDTRRGQRAGNAHHADAGDELYALCDERYRLARPAGDRRLQARAPQGAVHHVRHGPAEGRAHKKRQHRGQHHAPEPARRRGHLRHHGAPCPHERKPAGAVCIRQGQLWQGVQPRHGVRRLALHRGQTGARVRGAVPRHRQGHCGFCGQLRRHHHRAHASARDIPHHFGEQYAGHCRGHGLVHLLVQPGRAVRDHHRPFERPAARHQGHHARAGFCGRRLYPV